MDDRSHGNEPVSTDDLLVYCESGPLALFHGIVGAFVFGMSAGFHSTDLETKQIIIGE